MRLKRLGLAALAIAMTPSFAFAHDEEVIFLPIGQAFALLVIWILALKVPVASVALRLVAALVALAIIVGTWFTSVQLPHVSFETKSVIVFLIGFTPSVAFFAGALIAIRLWESRSKANSNAGMPQIEVEVKLQRPLLAGYTPHFRIGAGEYLGVRFSTAGETLSNGFIRATVSLMYWPQVNYEALTPGASFDILEGPRVIGHGTVLGHERATSSA